MSDFDRHDIPPWGRELQRRVEELEDNMSDLSSFEQDLANAVAAVAAEVSSLQGKVPDPTVMAGLNQQLAALQALVPQQATP